MAVSLSLLAGAGWQFFDDNGNPLSGGLLYTYEAGTSTPLATYTDSNGNVANANPIVLDAAGRSANQIWLNPAYSYKFILKTSLGITVWTEDDVPGYGSSANVTFLQAGTGAVARTVQSKLRDVVSVKDFGAVGDGTTNDTAAITAALAAGNNIYFPDGTYRITSSIAIESNKLIVGAGQRNSIIKVDGAIYGFGKVYGSQTTSRAEIKGLAFQGTASALGGIYFENATRVRIDSCDFYDFTATGAYGVKLSRVYHWWVSNCGFENINSVGLTCTAISGVGCNHGIFGPNNDVIGNNQANFTGLNLTAQNVFVFGNNFEGSNNGSTAINLNDVEGVFIVQNYIELWLGAAIAANSGGANRRVTVEQNVIHASTPIICNFNNPVNPNDNIIFRSNRFGDSIVGQTCAFFGTTTNPLFQDNDPNNATPTDVLVGNPKTPQVLYGSTTWDPGAIANNGSDMTTFTVSGAEVGDVCSATFSTIGGRNMLLTAHVQSANTVRAVLFNNEGAAVDLPSGSVNVVVFKQ